MVKGKTYWRNRISFARKRRFWYLCDFGKQDFLTILFPRKGKSAQLLSNAQRMAMAAASTYQWLWKILFQQVGLRLREKVYSPMPNSLKELKENIKKRSQINSSWTFNFDFSKCSKKTWFSNWSVRRTH